MHREPLPLDIVRVPGSEAPERVVSVDDRALTLAPLDSDDARTIERPARERIALLGIAAAGRKRRAEPAAPETIPDADTTPIEICALPPTAVQIAAHEHTAQVIDSPECVELTDRCLRAVYGASGVDPSELF